MAVIAPFVGFAIWAVARGISSREGAHGSPAPSRPAGPRAVVAALAAGAEIWLSGNAPVRPDPGRDGRLARGHRHRRGPHHRRSRRLRARPSGPICSTATASKESAGTAGVLVSLGAACGGGGRDLVRRLLETRRARVRHGRAERIVVRGSGAAAAREPAARLRRPGCQQRQALAGVLAGLVGLIVTGRPALRGRRSVPGADAPDRHGERPRGIGRAAARSRRPRRRAAPRSAASCTGTRMRTTASSTGIPHHHAEPHRRLRRQPPPRPRRTRTRSRSSASRTSRRPSTISTRAPRSIAALLLILGVVLGPPPQPAEFAARRRAARRGHAARAAAARARSSHARCIVLPVAAGIALFAPLASVSGRVERSRRSAAAYRTGWALSWSIIAKAWLGAFTVIVLAATTPPRRSSRAWGRCDCPVVFMTMLTFLYRYTDVLRGQLPSMRRRRREPRAGRAGTFGSPRCTATSPERCSCARTSAASASTRRCSRAATTERCRRPSRLRMRAADALVLATAVLASGGARSCTDDPRLRADPAPAAFECRCGRSPRT